MCAIKALCVLRFCDFMHQYQSEFMYLCRTASSREDVESQRRRDAAQVFRQRHHISQEDTLSMNSGSFEDLSRIAGRAESPARVQVTNTKE